MSAAISSGKILHELEDLWIGMGSRDGHAAVLRACAMTLIVVTDEDPADASMGETIADIMPQHPCRAIVLRCRQGTGDYLDAQVRAQCWLPGGKREQICCEQIEITASESSIGQVPAVVRGLLVPDLPVSIYCRQASLLELPVWELLAPLATRIIVDSTPDDPRICFRALERASQWGCLLGDLSWTRLTRWRQIIAQVFESSDHRQRLPAIESIVIAVSGRQVPAPAWYLGAWLARGAGWTFRDGQFWRPGGAWRIGFELAGEVSGAVAAGCLPASGIREVRLEGTDVDYRLTRSGQGTVEVRMGDVTTSFVFGPWREGDLLSQELSLPGRDHLYRQVLEIVLPWVLGSGGRGVSSPSPS